MNTQTRQDAGTHVPATTRPTTLIRMGLIIIALAFGGAGTWAALAPLSAAVIAEGSVKVEDNRKTVQHLDGGIIKEIRVRDGEKVRAGQTLLVLSDERTQAQYDAVRLSLSAERARLARLKAERDAAAVINFPQDLLASSTDARVAEAIAVERRLFETSRQTLDERLALVREQMTGARTELQEIQARLEAEDNGRAKLAAEVQANESLQAQGFISRMQVLRLQRGLEEYASRRAAALADLSRARQKLADLQLRASSLRGDALKAAADEYVACQSKIAQIETQLKPSADSVMRQSVQAPIAGTVVEMKFHTVGGVVGPREPILAIVPDDVPMIVESKVQLDDIHHVEPGMPADVRLTTYSSRNTPLLVGKVTYISADKAQDKVTGQEHFVVHVRIDPATLAAADTVKLVSGMRAEVFLKTGERTAVDYILDPVTSTLRRASRQP